MPSSVTQRSAWMVTSYPIGDSGRRSKQVKSLVLVLFESTSVVNPGVRFYSNTSGDSVSECWTPHLRFPVNQHKGTSMFLATLYKASFSSSFQTRSNQHLRQIH